jgi:YHS domain-containing protein
MFVEVKLPVELPATIAVAAGAVLDSGLKKTVFVDRGGGYFEPLRVETGWRFGGRVELARGLEAGERIVISGNFLLDSESRMKQLACTQTAAAPAESAAEPAQSATDPVCGIYLGVTKTGYQSAYGGKSYPFCSGKYRQAFTKKPERYLNKAAAGNRTPARGPS